MHFTSLSFISNVLVSTKPNKFLNDSTKNKKKNTKFLKLISSSKVNNPEGYMMCTVCSVDLSIVVQIRIFVTTQAMCIHVWNTISHHIACLSLELLNRLIWPKKKKWNWLKWMKKFLLSSLSSFFFFLILYKVRHLTFFFQLVLTSWMVILIILKLFYFLIIMNML